MLLPVHILEKINYYHLDVRSGDNSITDVIIVSYKSIFRQDKEFRFKRHRTLSEDREYYVYTTNPEFLELNEQLHNYVRDLNKTPYTSKGNLIKVKFGNGSDKKES